MNYDLKHFATLYEEIIRLSPKDFNEFLKNLEFFDNLVICTFYMQIKKRREQ